MKKNAGGVAPVLFKITTKICPCGVVPPVAGLGVVGRYCTHKSPLLLHKEGGKCISSEVKRRKLSQSPN